MTCIFGEEVLIEPGAILNVIGGSIGDRTIIRAGARIEGNSVVLGRESYIDHGAVIGGGSCMDEGAFLNAGDFFHMGWNSQVNIARGVEIGDEVGVGIETKIFTHGAYLPADFGFPVQWAPVKIGNRVWLPNAWVNPGVTIGDNVVVTARSLINSDLPSGCLAGGIPAKILKEDCRGAFDVDALIAQIKKIVPEAVAKEANRGIVIIYKGTYFDISARSIEGPVNDKTEAIKNQLRRNGIRFKFKAVNGEYVPW